MTRQRPITLGIVGNSAAGKTTITQGLVKYLGVNCVTHVCTDDYHKYDRKERAEHGITALHPECNYMDVIELHLERMHYGQPILKPVYDHATGTLVRPGVRPHSSLSSRACWALPPQPCGSSTMSESISPRRKRCGGSGKSSAIRPSAATPPSRC